MKAAAAALVIALLAGCAFSPDESTRCRIFLKRFICKTAF